MWSNYGGLSHDDAIGRLTFTHKHKYCIEATKVNSEFHAINDISVFQHSADADRKYPVESYVTSREYCFQLKKFIFARPATKAKFSRLQGLSVRLAVCRLDHSKSYERILTKFRGGVDHDIRKNWTDFGRKSGSFVDSRSQSMILYSWYLENRAKATTFTVSEQAMTGFGEIFRRGESTNNWSNFGGDTIKPIPDHTPELQSCCTKSVMFEFDRCQRWTCQR